MRRGYTLMELLMVVLVIGILAWVAVPQYGRAVERANWQAAKDSLQTIYAGEQVYRSMNPAYLDPSVTTCTADTTLPGWGCLYMDDPATGTPVTYSFANMGAATFTATATRNGGACGNWTRTMNESKGGTWTDPTPC